MNTVHLAISVFGLANGFTCSLFLLINRGKHRQANTYLAYLLLVLTGLQAYMALLASLETHRAQNPLLHLFLQNDLLIAPYWYAFVYTWLVDTTYRISPIHYIPFVVEKCYRATMILLTYVAYPQWVHKTFILCDGLWQLVVVGPMVFYFYLCMRLVRQHKRQAFEYFTDSKQYDMAWLKQTHYLILCIILLFGSMSLVDGMFYGFTWTDLNYWPVTICISTIMVWLSLKSYKSDFSSVHIALPATKKPLDPILMEQAKTLHKQIVEGRYFLDPELDLAKLATSLNIHKGLLSRLINEGLGLSFSDFINQMRVDDFTAKLKEPHKWAHLSLMGMAYESGFASKATFNRVFKNLTGKTPKAYKDDLETP